MTRIFVLTGAPHPTELRDRASAHGEVIAVVAHRAPGPGWYGAAEISPPPNSLTRVASALTADALSTAPPVAGEEQALSQGSATLEAGSTSVDQRGVAAHHRDKRGSDEAAAGPASAPGSAAASELAIAALFVEERGVYADLPGVDVWGVSRDARTYPGRAPVVAHPPCARWCRLAGLVEKRWGHKRGEDGGCFASALASVRRWGGGLGTPGL